MARRREKTIEQQSEEALNRGIKILESYKIKINEERKKRLNEPESKTITSAKRVFRYIFLVILIIGIILIINYGPILGIKIIDLEKEQITIDNILSNEAIYMEYNNEFLVCVGSEVITYDSNGNETWKYTLEDSFIPCIYTNGKYLVIANKTNGMIYYFSNKKEIANKVIEGDIENIYIAEDGRFVVQYTKKTGYKKIIAMYDNKAKLKYNEVYVDSTPIIGIEFLAEKNKLLLVQADSSLINIGTVFTEIDFESENHIQIYTILKNKLVYNYKLVNDEIIYISNSAVESYNITTKQEKIIHNLSEGQTNYVTLYNNYFVTVETKETGYEVISKKFDDTKISSNLLTVFPKYIEMSGLLTYIISENSIDVINKWGVIVEKIDIALSPKDVVIFNSEKAIALIYSNKVEIVKL